MNTVENPCVTVMALTKPSLLASEGPANVANPVTKLDTPNIGPLIESLMPYRSPNHAAIKGTTIPAPNAINPLQITYRTSGSFDL